MPPMQMSDINGTPSCLYTYCKPQRFSIILTKENWEMSEHTIFLLMQFVFLLSPIYFSQYKLPQICYSKITLISTTVTILVIYD